MENEEFTPEELQEMELFDEKLKVWLFAAWRRGSIGSGDSEETDQKAFDEWYDPELITLDLFGGDHDDD